MPRPGPCPRPSKYQPLVDYLAAQQDDCVHLPLDHIEVLVGFPLPDAAYGTHSFWANSPSILVRIITAAGWRGRLRVREQAVVFTRTAARQK